MKMMNEGNNGNNESASSLPASVEAILRAQPLNPFVRLEFEAGGKSWSTIDPDSKAASRQATVGGLEAVSGLMDVTAIV